MLGLLFVGGQAPVRCQEIFTLTTQAKFIIAADSGLATALLYIEDSIEKIDYLIGDMDSVDHVQLASFPKSQILNYPCDKDNSDTELGIIKLQELGCQEIIIIGGGGGRVDHFLANIILLETHKAITRAYFAESRITKVDKYFHGKNSINSLISIFPLKNNPAKIKHSLGLSWDLTGKKLTKTQLSLSNRFAQEHVHIEVASGAILIIEECSNLSEIL